MIEISPKEALHEDLLRDWQDQKRVLKEQITLIDPMATSLRKSTAQRFVNATWNVLMETMMYLLAIGCIAYLFFMNNLGPFFVVSKVANDREIVPTRITETDMQNVDFSIKGLFILLAILFFIIGRMLANIRRKNVTLSLAGKNMKIITGQQLNRKQAIQALEEKHVMVMPATDIVWDSVEVQRPTSHHDDTLL